MGMEIGDTALVMIGGVESKEEQGKKEKPRNRHRRMKYNPGGREGGTKERTS